MPNKRKKIQARKAKKEEKGAKAKSKSKSQILLSAHAWTSQANILHLDYNVANWMTCKQFCGKFLPLMARQWPENCLTSFETHFRAKSPGANGLSLSYQKLHFSIFFFIFLLLLLYDWCRLVYMFYESKMILYTKAIFQT